HDERTKEALFRYAVLGPLITTKLRRGERKRLLRELAEKTWTDPQGLPRQVAAKTLEEWLYRYRRGGLDGLVPQPRTDAGVARALSPELVTLVLDMKREGPGRVDGGQDPQDSSGLSDALDPRRVRRGPPGARRRA